MSLTIDSLDLDLGNTFMQMEFWDGPGGVWEFLSSLRDTASHDVDVSEAEAVPPAASGSHE